LTFINRTRQVSPILHFGGNVPAKRSRGTGSPRGTVGGRSVGISERPAPPEETAGTDVDDSAPTGGLDVMGASGPPPSEQAVIRSSSPYREGPRLMVTLHGAAGGTPRILAAPLSDMTGGSLEFPFLLGLEKPPQDQAAADDLGSIDVLVVRIGLGLREKAPPGIASAL
jgi:hypothetical protein